MEERGRSPRDWPLPTRRFWDQSAQSHGGLVNYVFLYQVKERGGGASLREAPASPFGSEFHTENHLLALGFRAEDGSINHHARCERLEVLRAFLTLSADDGARVGTREKLETAGIAIVCGTVLVFAAEVSDLVGC
jgi:hypothetical protein